MAISRPPTPLERRRSRRAWRWSAWMHIGILAGLIAEALWFPLGLMSATAGIERDVIIAHSAVEESAEPLVIELAADECSWMMREAEDVAATQVDLGDPRWQDILSEPERHRHAAKSDAGGSSLLSEELMRRLTESKEGSTEANLGELARLSERLEQVSSTESVDELSGTLGRLLGVGSRASAPEEKVPGGPFDFTTAQLHDVRKEILPDGSIRYIAILVDAAGRTSNDELSAADGEQAYETMQLVKSNPLLQRIYRGVVMSLMDKLLKSEATP